MREVPSLVAAFGNQREPESATALRERQLLADCLVRLGRREAAALRRPEIAAAEPEVARDHADLVAAWLEAGRPERALAAADRALSAQAASGCLGFHRGAACEALAALARRDGLAPLARESVRAALESYDRAADDEACGEKARPRRKALTAAHEDSGRTRDAAALARRPPATAGSMGAAR